MPYRRKFVPVMLTPFMEDGSIDYYGLTLLTEFYLKAGAKGLFANCLSSEMYELTREERLQSVKHILSIVNGAVPVLATGTFNESIEEQIAFSKEMYSLGVEAIMVNTSVIVNEDESDDVLDERILKFIDLTSGISLGFYECYLPYRRILSSEQLGRYATLGRVIYHNDSSHDINCINSKLDAVKVVDFGLYDAFMGHAVQSLKAGVAGLSCIQGNYFPELIAWLCDNFNDTGLQNQVNIVQEFLIANMDVVHTDYPTAAKYFLQKRGLPISLFSRHPVGGFTNEARLQVEELFNDYQHLRSELGI